MDFQLDSPRKHNRGYFRLRKLYRRYVDPRFSLSRRHKQRIKTLWFIGGYAPMLRIAAIPLRTRLWLLWRCIRIDWHVPHGHEPRDCAATLASLGERRARTGEVMVEAGCWQGGSTAKWSLACKSLGYKLHVYDSFEGVEARTELEGKYDFSGEYAAPLALVREHVEKFGDISVCTFHQGWFQDTMRPGQVPGPVRLVYIDCDLVKGTREVLEGVIPCLSEDAVVTSQDGQIAVVADFLASQETWRALGVRVSVARHSRHLVEVRILERLPE